uniref:Cupin RmIC-type protein n=1 Tax=Cladonia uncialis subsp. uncialis TaxID=180999 RepID=A0A1Z1CCP6_CLAUC|nr:cupin RmIC-type protein [Cladonia uncialis subsp. uncialis]AUW31356.1 putative cupin RmIC-type [Cladonia uncialis subsp. uncialis]
MAPFVPYHTSAGQSTIINFGGLLTTEFLEPPPGRCFLFRQTYKHDIKGPVPANLRKLLDSPKRPKGPLLHFHQFQTEYFRVEAGLMGIHVDGVEKAVTAEDGEISVKAGSIHQFFIHPDSQGDMTVYLSASDSGMDFQLDRIFFENWYGYWHDALLHDGGLNLFQYLAIQDGGDAYTPAPAWVPFRRTVGYWTCVILGRWIGGMLGYRPFFREYTTDWDYAVAKMRGSFFQRHLVEQSFTKAKSWPEQVELSNAARPTNAEYELWTQQLHREVNGVAEPNEIRNVNGVTDSGGIHKVNTIVDSDEIHKANGTF